MSNRGRRYEEPKLNIKKVIAVVVAIIVLIMFVFLIKGILTKEEKSGNKIVSISYFAAFKDNKWGVINSEGNVVIDPSYQEMIIVPNSKNDVFLCTYDVNYETGEYKTKVLNNKNEEIFKDYEKIEAIQNSDENNNLWYEDNVLKVKKGEKYGLINLSGKELLKSEYTSINALKGIKNAIIIEKDGKFGIVDNEGKTILDPIYLEVTNLGKDNKSGYIVKNENGKYGIVDYSKTQILEAKYDGVERIYNNELYVVIEGGKQKIVNKAGEDVLTEGFDEIKKILKNQDLGVIYKANEKYGVMTLSGDVTLEANFDNLEEGKMGALIATKDSKVGIVDISGSEKVPYQYNSIVYNEAADIYIAEDENINSNIMDSTYNIKLTGILIELNTEKGFIKLKQGDLYKYYNFKFEEKDDKDILINNTLFLSKKDGKYGLLNEKGDVVVDYIYDDATEQNVYGFVGVKKDGKWGCIDNKGNMVIEPTYNLDNYLIVDFIGRWHFGQDINMKYYNQL